MKRLITFVLVLYSYFLIKANISHLPPRIPTHFNAAGEANGWGSPDSLWFLLLVQLLTCGVLLAVPFLGRRHPGMVHIGFRTLSDFTPAQRERIMPLLTDMMEYVSVLVGVLFCILLRQTIRAALSSHPHFSPWWIGAFLIGVAAIVIYYLRRIFAAANDTGRESPGAI
jgi:uncharacterized membrane protein